MNALPLASHSASRHLAIYAEELKAEKHAAAGDYEKAARVLQDVVDKLAADPAEKGWYLQEAARHLFRGSKVEASKLQVAAHNRHRYLLKPVDGVKVSKPSPLAQRRVANIHDFVNTFDSGQELMVAVEEILSSLTFGTSAERFESALARIGSAIGFSSERPEKEWKEGPDNLWCLKDGQYILWECKSEVESTRAEIAKYETEQINASGAWFNKNYEGCQARRILIIPTKKASGSAAFLFDTHVLRAAGLQKLVYNIRGFFRELRDVDFKSLADNKTQEALDRHKLSLANLLEDYAETPKA